MNKFRGKYNHRWRRTGEALLNGMLAGGWVARASHACGLHGRLGVSEHHICMPLDKKLGAPLKIAFASDFHAGPSTHRAIFDSLGDAIARHRPDVLLLGGDFVSGHARNVGELIDVLARCHAPLGKFAVFGNHDLWTDEALLLRMLAGAGVSVLNNQNIALPAPFHTVSVCGMDDPWTGTPDIARTFKGAHASRILLMHAPDGLLLLNGASFDLGFAGHTHGGQIAWRDGRPLLVPHGPLCRQYCHGRYQIAGNGELIVSRGVGNSTLPVRIHADPELVICHLQ